MITGWEISGDKAFNRGLDLIMAAVDDQTNIATRAGAHLIEGYSKASFGPAHPKGTPHTPGEIRPQSITGTLRRSIEVLSVNKIGKGRWQGRVAPQTIYGRRIELGFPKGLHAYPYMQPGVDKSLAPISQVYEGSWRIALRS